MRERAVYAEKAIAFDNAVAGNDHMRANEIMIVNGGVVANMVAAPECNIVADLYERLYGVVFENKAIVAAGELL